MVPAAWAAVVNDQNVLADSLRNYISSTLTKLGNENLLPDIIQIGNETNRGILLSQEVNDQGWTLDWSRNVFLFKAAQAAIDEIEFQYGVPIPTAIHIADPADVPWYIEQFVANGYNDFDIIGISYYWQWHQPVSIPQVGQIITSLKQDHPGKDVMIFETGYGWTTQNADAANNILFNTHPDYTPLSMANQKQWMIDLTQEVIDHGGKGLVYWEPAWISTGCSTQWGVGSHWDNATFFSADGELMEDGGIGWMSHNYNFTSLSSPNPSTLRCIVQYFDGKVILRIEEGYKIDFPITIQLYSMDGRIIYSGVASHFDGSDKVQITIPNITPGAYLCHLNDNAFRFVSSILSIIE